MARMKSWYGAAGGTLSLTAFRQARLGQLEAAREGAWPMERKLIPFPMKWPQRRDEREFLPAALEIIETPVSVAGRVMIVVIIVLVAVAIFWACLGKLDIVSTATGRIIPSGQIKLIQPLEIGVVKRIMVADGDHVEAGDVLIELDPTTNAADRDRFARDLVQAELDIARLRATLTDNAEAFVAPDGADLVLVDAARQQLTAQLAQHRAKIEGLDRQIEAKTAERDQAKAVIEKLDATVPLLQDKVEMYLTLRESQLTSKVSLIDAQRQLVEAQHDRIATGHQVEGLQAHIEALAQQRNETDADFKRQALDDMRKASQSAAEQSKDLIKAAQRTGLQTLRAPVNGTVEQLSVHTIGGVVTPAQSLMIIVPNNSKLEVEAALPNREVGFVHAGQAAELKVEAFTYTRYGLLHGNVRDVSRDALRSERDEAAPDPDAASGAPSPRNRDTAAPAGSAYVARISLDETAVETEQGSMPLEPGMTVTAEIKTGQRYIITYLLSPFMRYRHEALRER
jgi:hemolysin D